MWIAADASKGYLCDSTHPSIEMVIKSKRNNIIEIDMVLKKERKAGLLSSNLVDGNGFQKLYYTVSDEELFVF